MPRSRRRRRGPTLPGLRARGRQVVLGAPGNPLLLQAFDLIGTSRVVAGYASGTAMDSQNTLRFAARREQAPLAPALRGYPAVPAPDVRNPAGGSG